MKYIIILAVVVITVYSCEVNFSPFAEYQEIYSLNCILRSDSTFQVATLFHSYPPGEYNPVDDVTDPAIKGADIRVWYNDSVYVFRDTSITRTDSSRYNTPFSFYYNNSFKVSTNKSIEIEVLLQNGRRLKAQSRTPEQILFRDESSVVVSPANSNIVQFFWQSLGEGTFYSPSFAIKYIQLVNGEPVEKTKVIPVRYIQTGDNYEPVFPDPDDVSGIVYEINAITRALNEISEVDENKQKYSIFEFPVFNLIAFDKSASSYVSSTGQSIDDFTVSVNVADYTNINGGLGIFGSYTKKNYDRIRFLQEFIESFGYNFIREN
jgi:hypothetical protein